MTEAKRYTIISPDGKEIIKENTPLLSSWLEAYRNANKDYPQTNIGITLISGNAIMRSLTKAEVDWQYVAHSDFSQQQMEALLAWIPDVHRGFGITHMPEGCENDGETSFSHTEINHIWSSAKTHLTLNLFNVLINDFPPSYARKPHGHYIPRQEDNTLLQEYLNDPSHHEQIARLASLYAASAEALDMPEAQRMGKERKEAFNYKKMRIPLPEIPTRDTPSDIMAVERIARFTRRHVVTYALQNNFPHHEISRFIDAIF